jgi:hypothetical protein
VTFVAVSSRRGPRTSPFAFGRRRRHAVCFRDVVQNPARRRLVRASRAPR